MKISDLGSDTVISIVRNCGSPLYDRFAVVASMLVKLGFGNLPCRPFRHVDGEFFVAVTDTLYRLIEDACIAETVEQNLAEQRGDWN